MKVLNLLFESDEMREEKISVIEEENRASLAQSYDEIRLMLEGITPIEEIKPIQKEVIHPYLNNFPVDYRIEK